MDLRKVFFGNRSDRRASQGAEPVTATFLAHSTANPLTDAEARQLVQQVQQLDRRAMARLYHLYSDRIFRYIYYRTSDRSRAEELTGELFVRVLENIKDFRPSSLDQGLALTGWIYRIAHNMVVDEYRRQKVRGIQEAMPDELDEKAFLHDQEEWHIARADLQQALRRLTDEQQTVILLRFQDGMTCSEIAEILGKTETAVKALQRRALAALTRHLAPESEAQGEQTNIAARE